jgi:hypothetical protein
MAGGGCTQHCQGAAVGIFGVSSITTDYTFSYNSAAPLMLSFPILQVLKAGVLSCFCLLVFPLPGAKEKERRKRRGGPLHLKGLVLPPKALAPFVPIYLQGVLQVSRGLLWTHMTGGHWC